MSKENNKPAYEEFNDWVKSLSYEQGQELIRVLEKPDKETIAKFCEKNDPNHQPSLVSIH